MTFNVPETNGWHLSSTEVGGLEACLQKKFLGQNCLERRKCPFTRYNRRDVKSSVGRAILDPPAPMKRTEGTAGTPAPPA